MTQIQFIEAQYRLKDKFRIGAYPTLLLVNPDGQVIVRVEGTEIRNSLFSGRANCKIVIKNKNRPDLKVGSKK